MNGDNPQTTENKADELPGGIRLEPVAMHKNFFPSTSGFMGTRSGIKPIPNPRRSIFYRLGVKLGLIPQTTFINMVVFQDRLFVATNYGVFWKDDKDVFHPLRFENE